MTSLGEDNWQLTHGTLLDVVSCASFNLHPFTMINCNHEYNSSVCSVSPIKTEGGLGDH